MGYVLYVRMESMRQPISATKDVEWMKFYPTESAPVGVGLELIPTEIA